MIPWLGTDLLNVWKAGKTGMKSAGVILSKLPFYPIFFQFFKLGFFAEMGSLMHPSSQDKRIFQKCYQNYKKK